MAPSGKVSPGAKLKSSLSMSITIYKKGDHPAGFIGIRVAVMIDSRHHQKYFNFRDNTRKNGYVSASKEKELVREAKALNEKWLSKQKESSKNRKIRVVSPDNKVNNTGIPCLSCLFTPRYLRRAPPKSYALKLQYFVYIDGKRQSKSRIVDDISSIEPAWRDMTRSLARARGLARTPPKWNKSIPSFEHLQEARARLIQKHPYLENPYWDAFLA